jgi:hypothetical protein
MTSLLLFATWASIALPGEVPLPQQTPAQVVVSGRSSTPKSIAIQNVGQNIPITYSKDRLKNAKGFTWFVSSHYALQTDYPEDKAKFYLTLLELAYPHYVELFGREPVGIGKTRMAVIYGSTTDSLKTALAADGIYWDFGGGGITFEGCNAAFNYPSGTLQYHQRYILLHECAHLFQMCLFNTTRTTPGWYYEGIADAFGHHVWDAEKQKLTLNVVDKPTVNNWYDQGLARYATEPFKASEILAEKKGGRDLGFLLVNYFSTDLDRLMRIRIWRDELFRLAQCGKYHEASAKLIEELFGIDKLDKDFDGWLKARKSSFHYVDWGWEQDGDTLVSYGWPQTGAFSQTDLLLPLNAKAQYDPLVMDYPYHVVSPLVDKPHRGVPEPIVGCLVGFRLSPDSGIAGMALGVEGRTFLKVLVEQRKRLIVDGADLGAAKRSLEFNDAFLQATSKTYQIGLTVKLAAENLEVTVKANDGGILQKCSLTLPISKAQRERLLTKPMAVLSRDGRHEVTPYIDDARRVEPDWGSSTPPNRWWYLLEPQLYQLYRAEWRLGKDAPASLIALKKKLLGLVDKGRAVQEKAKASFKQNLIPISKDIQACGAVPENVKAALEELIEK